MCIAGVADQLQTNFASDLRNILKCVFLMNSTESTNEEDINNDEPASTNVSNMSNSNGNFEDPVIEDENEMENQNQNEDRGSYNYFYR